MRVDFTAWRCPKLSIYQCQMPKNGAFSARNHDLHHGFCFVKSIIITKNSKTGHTFSLNFSTRCLRMISVAPFHIWYMQFRPFKTMRDWEKVQYPLTYKSRHWNWRLFVTKKTKTAFTLFSITLWFPACSCRSSLSLSLSQLCFLLFYSGVWLISLILNTFFC